VTVEFLMILLLTIILASVIAKMILSIFGNTGAAEDSFDALYESIRKSDEDVKSQGLKLARKAPVVFFNPSDDAAILIALQEPLENEVPIDVYDRLPNLVIKKPDICKDKSCMCMCRSLDSVDNHYLCENPRCRNDFGMNFQGSCSDRNNLKRCKQGLIFERGYFSWVQQSYPVPIYYVKRDGMIGIYTINPDLKSLEET